MKPFRRLEAVAVPFGGVNVDTDQIVPARYLQKPRACDFGEQEVIERARGELLRRQVALGGVAAGRRRDAAGAEREG